LKWFDVVIIGGGLSGSATALNLSKKGYSALVIEKEKFQDYKPCAGGMASSMQKYLPLDIKDSIESKIKNLYIATGHYRNGVLFSAITSDLLLKIVQNKNLKEIEKSFLEKFSLDRFTI